MNQEHFRVTSIPLSGRKYVVFSGVPLKRNSYQLNSGKYYIIVKAPSSSLPVPPSVGQHWQVSGTCIKEEKPVGDYVLQQHSFENPDKLACILPETNEQLIQFIARERDFEGIGEQFARKLVHHLGLEFHAVVSAADEAARRRIGKILTEQAKTRLFEGYQKYKNLKHCNWMSEVGIPAPVQQRLLKHHDEHSVDAIQNNPYRLLGFGMEFSATDRLAKRHLDVQNSSPLRLSAALESAIQQQVEKGHTYTTMQRVRSGVKELLGDDALVNEAFRVGHNKAQYILNADTGNYHPTGQLIMEMVVKKRFQSLLNQPKQRANNIENACKKAITELPYDLTDKQYDAVMMALLSPVSCITGGAGTGKTTVLRTGLKAYHYLGYSIHAVALSGRAAMRLHESIGFETMTIAGLLRQKSIEPSAETSAHHVLVIDEASMIDLPTMYRLVTHLHPTVRIIFTGDPDQLPPIGAGKVLSDIVEAKTIPNTMLDIVKRQGASTGIPEYSRLINQGVVPEALTTGNIVFHETRKSDIARTCATLYQNAPQDSRVVAPTKALVAEINELIQTQSNPNGARLEFALYGEQFFRNLREGDAILFTENNYECGVQNGSLGTLTSVNGEDGIYGEVTLDTRAIVKVSEALLDSMELGYAITLHKAQGSQFPRIIIALKQGQIVDRAWLYTAITRAEHEIHIVGESADFVRITERNSKASQRLSNLKNILIQPQTRNTEVEYLS